MQTKQKSRKNDVYDPFGAYCTSSNSRRGCTAAVRLYEAPRLYYPLQQVGAWIVIEHDLFQSND